MLQLQRQSQNQMVNFFCLISKSIFNGNKGLIKLIHSIQIDLVKFFLLFRNILFILNVERSNLWWDNIVSRFWAEIVQKSRHYKLKVGEEASLSSLDFRSIFDILCSYFASLSISICLVKSSLCFLNFSRIFQIGDLNCSEEIVHSIFKSVEKLFLSCFYFRGIIKVSCCYDAIECVIEDLEELSFCLLDFLCIFKILLLNRCWCQFIKKTIKSSLEFYHEFSFCLLDIRSILNCIDLS